MGMTEILTGSRSFEVYSPNEFANLCGEFHCPTPELCFKEFSDWGVTKFPGNGPLGNGKVGPVVIKLRKATAYGPNI